MENLKHYFASANTGVGFFNLFEYINNSAKRGMLYIIKGGPGTGKSTLMKKVGSHFLKKGFNVEFFHCSSDYNSLDGVRLKDYNIAMVDGTAPHVTEASMPAIREKIVNVCDNINESVAIFEAEIKNYINLKSQYFKEAYLLIESAAKLHNCTFEIYKNNTTNNEPVKEHNNLLAKISAKRLKQKGQTRKLFLNAIADDGIISYETENFNNIIEIKNNVFIITQTLNMLNKTLNLNGYSTICFYHPLNPEHIIGVYIEKLNLYISGKEECSLLNNKSLFKIVNSNLKDIASLNKRAANMLQLAKQEHQQVEKFYIKNLNFKELDKQTTNIILEIENRISKKEPF